MASEPPGLVGWLLTSHHKRIGILILATGFIMFLFDGVLGACPAPVIATTFRRLTVSGLAIQFLLAPACSRPAGSR